MEYKLSYYSDMQKEQKTAKWVPSWMLCYVKAKALEVSTLKIRPIVYLQKTHCATKMFQLTGETAELSSEVPIEFLAW